MSTDKLQKIISMVNNENITDEEANTILDAMLLIGEKMTELFEGKADETL